MKKKQNNAICQELIRINFFPRKNFEKELDKLILLLDIKKMNFVELSNKSVITTLLSSEMNFNHSRKVFFISSTSFNIVLSRFSLIIYPKLELFYSDTYLKTLRDLLSNLINSNCIKIKQIVYEGKNYRMYDDLNKAVKENAVLRIDENIASEVNKKIPNNSDDTCNYYVNYSSNCYISESKTFVDKEALAFISCDYPPIWRIQNIARVYKCVSNKISIDEIFTTINNLKEIYVNITY